MSEEKEKTDAETVQEIVEDAVRRHIRNQNKKTTPPRKRRRAEKAKDKKRGRGFTKSNKPKRRNK